MKAFEVALTVDAEADLCEIIEFMDAREGELRADQILAQFEALIAHLGALPTKHPIVKELRDIGIVDYRETFFKPYRVIYRTVEKRVVVYLICDGRRDMTQLLQSRLLRVH